MRVIFIGQAPFGKDCLQALVNQGEEVVGVITVPDVPGQKRPNPVKELAGELSLPLFQPPRLRGEEVHSWVEGLAPDLLVLAFVTDIVARPIIELAALGAINYHPSLLPKYRGASAINWAVICGEKETGVTVHYIDEGIDTGDIILQEKVAIDPDDTVASLYFNKLYPLGVRLVAEAVRLIREGKAPRVPQDHALASYQPPIQEKHTVIDWLQPAGRVYDLIRGSNPVPGATTWLRGKKLKIWEARPWAGESLPGTPGEIIGFREGEGFLVATGDGAILVQRVQHAGEGKVAAAEFAGQVGLRPEERLGA